MTATERTDEIQIMRPDLQPQLAGDELAVVRLAAGWLPAAAPPGFFSVVLDELETTVVCATASVDAVCAGATPMAVERGWRRISFPGPLPWEIVGFLADVSTRLAGAHVPFTSMSGYTTDHVLVRAAQADLAIAVLSGEPPPPQRPGTNP